MKHYTSRVTPAYDAAGNMTTIPKPANPTQSYTGTYNPWNRLTAVKEGGDFVAEYQYDGAKRLAIQKTYASGVLSETRHLYYTDPSIWQVIEERVGSSSAAERQFVWGLRYIDGLVLHDRDTDGSGSLDERLYAKLVTLDAMAALAESYRQVELTACGLHSRPERRPGHS